MIKSLLLLLIPIPVIASSYPHWGGSLSIPIITKDPKYLYGYRAALWYQPESLLWERTRIYFDASFGRWWVTNSRHNKSLNIYSASPTLRYYFTNRSPSLFFNLSIGLAYLTRTRIAYRNLGMHFAFQDQVGIGISFGKKKQFSVSLSSMHYSNGSLCNKNGGITIPVMMNAEYGFA